MAQISSKYGELLQTLDNFRVHLEKDFRKESEDVDHITKESIPTLLADWGVTLAFDTEDAVHWYREGNPKLKKEYNFNRLSFKEFYEIFKLWLKDEDANIMNADTSDIEMLRQQSDVRPNSPRRANTINIPPNYPKNCKKMEQYVEKNRALIKEQFNSRVIEGTAISVQDLFPFLEASLHIEGKEGLMILERDHDSEDFFQSINSYKRLFAICSDFMIYRKGFKKGQFDVKEAVLTFDDCFALLDFWLSTDKEVLVLSDKEFEQKQSLRTDAVRQIRVGEFKDDPKTMAQKKEGGTVHDSHYVGHRESATQRETPYQKDSKSSNESEIIKTLRESMKNCESAIAFCQSDEEKRMMMNAIHTLKQKLSLLQNEQKTRNVVIIEQSSPLDKKMKGLNEIYQFYAKQHLRYGIYARFDTIKRRTQVMNFGEFVFVIKDFHLLKDKSDKPKVQEIFKLCSSNGKELEFMEFKRALDELALIYYQDDDDDEDDDGRHIHRNVNDKIQAFYALIGLIDGSYRKKIKDRQMASQEKRQHKIPEFLKGMTSDGSGAGDELASRPIETERTRIGGLHSDPSHSRFSTNEEEAHRGLNNHYSSAKAIKPQLGINPSDQSSSQKQLGSLYSPQYRSPIGASPINLPKNTKNTQSMENSVEPSPGRGGHGRNRSQDFQTPRQLPSNGKSPSMVKNGLSKNEMLERASQIEKDRQRKEQELMKNLYANQDSKIKKGVDKYSKY